MKKTLRVNRILAMLIIFAMMFSIATPVHAWQLNTHVYSANIILDELNSNRGKLEVYPYGKFQIPNEFYDALRAYPDAFRAGSMGPDIYPEMITGQSIIHTPKNGTPGEWLNLMVDEYRKMPNSNEKKKALAFILGFACHYAGDLFSNDYINEKAGGAFTDITKAADSHRERKIIERHMLLEAFIDSQVPENYKKGERIRISAPISFVRDTLINKGYNLGLAPFLNPIVKLRRNLRKVSYEMKAYEGDLSPGDLIKYGINTNIAGYSEKWMEDLDAGIYEYIRANENVAKGIIDPNASIKDTLSPIGNWMGDYASKMSPVPDVALKAIGIKKDALMEIANRVGLNEIEDAWNTAKTKAFVYAFEGVFGINFEEIIDYWKNPETYINTSLFDTGNQTSESIKKDLGNFNNIYSAKDISFDEFYNTIQMSKLVLLGADNLNKLFPNANFTKQQMIGSFDRVYIQIKTGENEWSFDKDKCTKGTDDDIFFIMRLKNGNEYKLLMDKPGYNDFESNDNDTYELELPEKITFGEIANLKVYKKSIVNDDWWPDYIRVYAQGGKNILSTTNFNRKFKGTTYWEVNINMNDENNGYSSFDPKVINFMNSLDESNQWKEASYLKSDRDVFGTIFRNLIAPSENIEIYPYYNDFDKDISVDFNIFGGEWVVENDALIDYGEYSAGDKIVLKDKIYRNFLLEASIGAGGKYANAGVYQDCGIIFRVENPKKGDLALDGYYFGINQRKDCIKIGKFLNGKYISIKDLPRKIEEYTDTNPKVYNLKVKAVGDYIEFYFEDEKIYSIKDKDIEYGSIGFRQYTNGNKSRGVINYLAITPLNEKGGIPKLPYPNSEVVPYNEDFSLGVTNEFEIFGGKWININNGVMNLSEKEAGDKIVLKDKEYRNFIAEIDMGLGNGYEKNVGYQDGGFLFRVTEPKKGNCALNGYYFGINHMMDQIKIGKFDGKGYECIIDIPYKIEEYTDKNPKTYKMKVKAVRNTMEFYFQGKHVYTLVDKDMDVGSIGFRQISTSNSTRAVLKSMNITPLNEHGRIPDIGSLNNSKAYSEEFKKDDYSIHNGSWIMNKYGLTGESDASGHQWLLLKDKNYSNFLAKTCVTLNYNSEKDKSSYHDTGMVFRGYDKNDKLTGYYFGISPSQDLVRIGKFENMKHYVISDIPYDMKDLKEEKGTYYTLDVKAVGNVIRFFVNDKEIYMLKDNKFSSGQIGLKQCSIYPGHTVKYPYFIIYPLDRNGNYE